MKKNFIDFSNKRVTRGLIGSIIILLLLIGLIESPKGFGHIILYPFLFVCGQFYLIPIVILILFSVSLFFEKFTRNKKFILFIVGVSLALLGSILIASSGLELVNEKYLTNLLPNYIEKLKESKGLDAIKLVTSSKLRGGLLGFFLFGLLADLTNKTVAIIISSFLIAAGVGLFVFYFISESKKYKNNNVINNTEDLKTKNTEPKYFNERSIISESKSFKNNDVVEEETPVVAGQKAKPFNVFEDNVFGDNNNISFNDFKSQPINNEIAPQNNIFKDNFEEQVTNSFENSFKEEPTSFESKPVEQKTSFFEPHNIETNPVPSNVELEFFTNNQNYELPPVTLLIDRQKDDVSENTVMASQKAALLDEKLKSLNIAAHVVNYIVAPAFTRFQIAVEPTVKINTIPAVKNDLMMALSSSKINILAPIPETPYVGVDIPNSKRLGVSFKECILDIPYEKKDKKLLINVGRDINGKVVSMSLDECPHLLVAGATGTGKSVCLNSIIMTLLCRTEPSEVQLMLIDPKKVEFKPYENSPHLICPIITDVLKATVALKKICAEMDKRYTLLEKYGKKDIKQFNRYMESQGLPKLPYIVVVVDELGDLMTQCKNDVEESIRRITQLARSSGIHLVIATQRPSVDVITGVIKSNIASRIAFAVSSSTDSRVILDDVGAEQLLGKGDMIMKLAGSLGLVRVQGCFVDDDEIDNVSTYLTKVSTHNYNPEFMNLEPPVAEQMSFKEISDEDDNSNGDELLIKILDYYIANQKKFISNTFLKRIFQIGYSTAARMLDILEANELIGPVDGNKPRQIYLDKLPSFKESLIEKGI